MPERENVPGRVLVAVVSDTALTGPFSYSKTRSTFRTVGAQRATTRTGLGGVPFIDFQKYPACVLAFVFQQGFQRGPSRVEHGLGHFGFRQAGAGDVAHNDQPVVINQLPTELVQRILAPVGDLGVDGFDALLVAGALRGSQLLLLITVEATRLQRLALTGCGRGFQAEIHTDTTGAAPLLRLRRHDHAKVPAATGVFGETARAELVLAKPVAVPHLVVLTVKPHLPAVPAYCAGVHRHPAQRAAHTKSLAPRQFRFTELLASGGVLLRYHLERLAVQAQLFPGPFGVGVNIVGRQEYAVFPYRAAAQIVHIVPDKIHRRRLSAQSLGVLVTHADFQGFGGSGIIVCHALIFAEIQLGVNTMKSHYHCVYNLKYHLVLVTKYRRQCFTTAMLDRLEAICREQCQHWDIGLDEFGGEADHVHLLLDMHPNIQPSRFINSLKTVTSRLLRKEFGVELSRVYRKPGLWTRAYCLITAGGAPLSILSEYIQNQERPKQ